MACGQQVPPNPLATPVSTLANTLQPANTGEITHKATVCGSGGLNFRTDPGTDNLVQNTYPDGTPVTLLDATQTTPDGAVWQSTEFGWVNAKYLCFGDFPKGENGVHQK